MNYGEIEREDLGRVYGRWLSAVMDGRMEHEGLTTGPLLVFHESHYEDYYLRRPHPTQTTPAPLLITPSKQLHAPSPRNTPFLPSVLTWFHYIFPSFFPSFPHSFFPSSPPSSLPTLISSLFHSTFPSLIPIL